MATLRTTGAALDHAETGQGEAIVLVHGSWVDRTSWGFVQPELGAKFRTISYSRRGHGSSAGEGTIDDDVDDLIALTERVAGGRTHLVANSLGAIISLRAAARRPEIFASLALHEPPLLGLLAGVPGTEEALQETDRRVGAVIALIQKGDREHAAERFVDDVALGPGTWAALPQQERDTFIRHAETFVEENTDPTLYGLDVHGLAAITSPVLLSSGGASPPFFGLVLEILARALPCSRRHHFSSEGHIPHVTNPKGFVAAVSEFLGR
jgi:pimeloyl-ACP methyl ester carboxylesterase